MLTSPKSTLNPWCPLFNIPELIWKCIHDKVVKNTLWFQNLHFWQSINHMIQEHMVLLKKADFPPKETISKHGNIHFIHPLCYLMWLWEMLKGRVFLSNFDIYMLLLIMLWLPVLFPFSLYWSSLLSIPQFSFKMIFVHKIIFHYSLVDLHSFLKVIFHSLIYLFSSHFWQFRWSFGQPNFYFLKPFFLAVLRPLLSFQHLQLVTVLVQLSTNSHLLSISYVLLSFSKSHHWRWFRLLCLAW